MDYSASHFTFFILFVTVFFFAATVPVLAQSKLQKQQIQMATQLNALETMESRLEKEYQKKEDKIKQFLAQKGSSRTEKRTDGTVIALADIGDDGTPLYYGTLLDPTSKVSRADKLHQNNSLDFSLNGAGLNVGIWDAGAALVSHQEFDVRAVNNDQSTTIAHHATMVTGTIISSGIKERAKGVAYKAQALTHDWQRDRIEVAEAAANGMLLSNHSYGIMSDRVPDWYFGAYLNVSKDWDEIMYNAPYYLMVTAAGNARHSNDNMMPNCGMTGDGYDLLLGFAVSKNGLTIAAANTEIDQEGNLESAQVSAYSSYGPTDDGRIKPDLAGDGTSIFSTTSTTNSSYSSAAGTSMAAPGVTGSLLLVQEYHEKTYDRYMKAATLKGLALHTADDVNAAGPDYKMGWGVLNAQRAVQVLQRIDHSAVVAEEMLLPNETYTITVTANGTTPLQASISWTDPITGTVNTGNLNDPTPTLTNDLDIRIEKDGITYFPWKLDPTRIEDDAKRGDNIVDPFERIDILEAEGEYTISVSHKGGLIGDGQDFTLIVSGVQLSNCELQVPENIELLQGNSSNAIFGWDLLNEALYEVQYTEIDSENWNTVHTWENHVALENLEEGKTYELRMRSVCTKNLASEFSEPVAFVFNGEDTKLLRPKGENIKISVYPNPTVDEISVDSNVENASNYSISDLSGNIVKNGIIDERINVSELASGMYVLMLFEDDDMSTAKFYKE